jgi:hypothetical protein
MAQKDLTLRIKTVETQLNKSLKKIEKLEGIINKLNSKKVKLNTSPAQRAAEKLRKEIEKGNKIVDKLFNPFRTDGFGKSIAKVNSQLSLVTKSFNAANSAAERQRSATALIAGNFKKMRMEATAFAQASGNAQALRGAAGGNVGNRLKEIKEFPKTILAGNKAMSILNGMLELAEVNSKEFLQISKAIGEQLKQNAQIQEAADKASGVSKKKQQLRDNQRTTQRIKAIREQTLNIERRIQDSTLNQATKDKLINNLKRSGVELDRKELELAKQINIETQRNLTMQEKMQRRRARITSSALIGGGFPLLFGGGPLQAIGGAIGGGIGESITPGGGFAGSIAVTAAVSSLGQFANSARELAEAVKTTSGTLELMETRSLFSSDAIQKQAKALQDQGKEAELAALLTDELTKALGPAGLGQLAGLAEQSREMNTQFGILKTSMELFISGPLTQLIKILNNVVGKANIVNQLDQSLSQLKKENPNEFKRITDQLKGSFIQNINPVSDRSKSVLGSFVNPSNLQVQGIPVGGFSKDILVQILQDVNKQLPAATLPFQTNLDTGDGGNGTSSGKKDFSKFELNILNKRIELQKLSGSLLDEEVEKAKRGIILAEASLKFAQAEGDIGKNKIIQAEKVLKLNQLDLEVEKAKGKAFAENVLKPQMDALAAQEQEEFDAGAALGKRLAAEVKTINNLDKEIQKMGLLTELEEAKTVEEKANIQFKLLELDLGQQIHDVNKTDILNLIKKKEGLIENNRLLKEQKQIAKDLNYTFAVEMSTAIKGLITGANSLNDAFRNVLNKMADAFLNIGLFGNVAGNLIGGKGLLGTLFSGFLANGGPAKAGKSYIVGERGPEMFTPGVTGTVTPNHALGGSTNVIVNVDASGSNVEGDEEQGRELGRMISVAIQSELIKQKRPGGMLA